MSRFIQFGICTFGVLVVGVLHANADVIQFDLIKGVGYEQISPTPPVAPVAFFFESFIDTIPGDATSADINGTPMMEFFSGEWDLEAEFLSQAALDAAYPVGTTYTMQLQGGVLGTRAETIQLSDPEVYPALASFTPTSFNALQGADPDQDLLVQWSVPDGNTTSVFFGLFSQNSDADLIDIFLPPTQTSLLVPAGTMDPGLPYEIEIGLINGAFFNGQPDPGFGTQASGISGIVTFTFTSFVTAGVNCPADINGDGTVDVVDLLEVISVWGPCPKGCNADINGDNVVDVVDLLEVIGTWGVCV